MNDFVNLEKIIVRELSCRLCLCTDVVKLKPLSTELKRKIKKLFNVTVRIDDNLPKAICHDCLQQVNALNLYAVKVEKTQKYLSYTQSKHDDIKSVESSKVNNLQPSSSPLQKEIESSIKEKLPNTNNEIIELQQGDIKQTKSKQIRKTPAEIKHLEVMPLEEFAETESVNKTLLNSNTNASYYSDKTTKSDEEIDLNGELDTIVIIDGKPAKEGAELDKQITLFYKMECCICHENNFHFRSLMKHYKERHGVPGYLTCCNKKFHYFYPKRIIEHMAYHLQPDIFRCPSCHQKFHSSREVIEHRSNGGRSEGKIVCPKCSERYPTYRELGHHIVSHRTENLQCDYCGKILKHHHRKKTINHMENVILCSHCTRLLKNIEKQEKEIKEKLKDKRDKSSIKKYQNFRQALGLSADEEASTD